VYIRRQVTPLHFIQSAFLEVLRYLLFVILRVLKCETSSMVIISASDYQTSVFNVFSERCSSIINTWM
jgi:hypothetical protein